MRTRLWKRIRAVAVPWLCLPTWLLAGVCFADGGGAAPAVRSMLIRRPPGRVSPALEAYMKQAPDDEFIPVLVILKRQLTDREKAAAFAAAPLDTARGTVRRVPKDVRGKTLLRALRQVADSTQGPLVETLRNLERRKLAARPRPMWIANAVGARIRKAGIEQLRRRPEIGRIDLDLPRRALLGAVPTWSVTHVRAEEVWRPDRTGYTGRGVVVGLLDTGIDTTALDLAQRLWVNPGEDADGDHRFDAADNNGTDSGTSSASVGNGYVDDVIGWDFANLNNHPLDEMGHGTWVAGVVAGDGTAGTQTGIAPGARLMILRCTSAVTQLTNHEAAWEGMQYALANGAAVVNASLGFSGEETDAFDGWRFAVENLMDGGVLFVTASGNDCGATRKGGWDVTVPGRVPSALTLGATDAADARWTDCVGSKPYPWSPYESVYGPVTWRTSPPIGCERPAEGEEDSDYPLPPGLPKPDLMAPGGGITTTELHPAAKGAAYTDPPLSGTSFAAAHASGVAALLLEKDPTLSPYEVKYVLQETARDIAPPGGRDAQTGWGILDAKAAVDYDLGLLARDVPFDLTISGATPGVWTDTEIWVDNDDDGVPDAARAGETNHLYARVRNAGGGVPSNVEVMFFQADVGVHDPTAFDPNGDGVPCDGSFHYVGSCRIPLIGPAGSTRQASAVAAAHWVPPDAGASAEYCIGVAVIGGNASNGLETNVANNEALRMLTVEPGTK